MLYRIASFDPIWLYLDVYESDLNWVGFGQQVDVRVEAFPGEVFRGTVTFIDPYLNDETRTVKARVNLKNSEGKLKPAMYASATIRVRLLADGSPEPTGLEGKYICPMHPEVVRDEPGTCPICGMQLERVPQRTLVATARPMAAGHEGHAVPAADPEMHADHPVANAPQPERSGVLAIPASAVLDTGRRQIAYRRNPNGSYELVELQLGPRAEADDPGGRSISYFPVLSGLQPGDKVVVRGGFLLDSQQQITGMPSLLFPEGRSVSSLHAGHGGDSNQGSMPAGHQH